MVGHSMGGMIAAIHAIRHPDQPGGVALLSTMARFDLDRLTEGFRRAAGDEVAALARQDYTGDDVSEAEWDRVFAAFGPTLPSADALARRRRNPDINARGMDAMRALDIVADLSKIKAPTLIVVGELDAVTPVEAAEEIRVGAVGRRWTPRDRAGRRPLHVAGPARCVLAVVGAVCRRRALIQPYRPLLDAAWSGHATVEKGQDGEHPPIVPGVLLEAKLREDDADRAFDGLR